MNVPSLIGHKSTEIASAIFNKPDRLRPPDKDLDLVQQQTV